MGVPTTAADIIVLVVETRVRGYSDFTTEQRERLHSPHSVRGAPAPSTYPCFAALVRASEDFLLAPGTVPQVCPDIAAHPVVCMHCLE